ncbi:GlsB/YeaQ/YmgE family stress response membrane protein [Nonomuraea fuscirosea]|uniref:GlsB/YeaQ/YmgE family stress response membrane protein n=1 Tax=Nonomuraea fuscirosea TaxID=1291556 RepID=UPI00343DFEC7
MIGSGDGSILHRQLIITFALGVAGALLGGFVATEVFHVSGIQGFFNLSTWVCAIVGAAVLLLAYNLITGRRSGRRSSHWAGRRWPRPTRLRARTGAAAGMCTTASCSKYSSTTTVSATLNRPRFPTSDRNSPTTPSGGNSTWTSATTPSS